MNKFKIGDKVIVKENFWEIENSVHINDEMKKLAGKTLEVEFVYDNGDVFTKQDDSKDDTEWSWDKNWLELSTEITWETLKWKDVVIDVHGDKRMVLLVANDLVDLSGSNNFDTHGTTFHKKELQKCGFTIKQDIPLAETIEIGGIKYNKDEVENALKDLKAQG